MSIDWNLYEKRLKINGNTQKERQINNMKNLFLSHYEDSPSCRSVYFNNSVTATDIWMIDTNVYGIKTILSMPNETFNVGDVVTYDDLTYLVITINEDSLVQTRGQIQLCNNILSIFKDSVLHRIPCIIESNIRFQDLRVEETKFINIPDDKIIARIPNNEITEDISRNLIFKLNNHDNYKVISVNRVTEPGLIVLKFEYVAEKAVEHNFGVSILNGNNIEIQQGKTLQLNVEVKDGNSILPSPIIVYSSNDEAICNVDENGLVSAISVGNCTISANANGISDNISIIVTETESHNYTYSLSSISMPDTEIKQSQSKIYTAKKCDNGNAIEQEFIFSVSGNENAYELTIIDGNNCSIKCLKSGYVISLCATELLDDSKVIEKNITLKNLY